MSYKKTNTARNTFPKTIQGKKSCKTQFVPNESEQYLEDSLDFTPKTFQQLKSTSKVLRISCKICDEWHGNTCESSRITYISNTLLSWWSLLRLSKIGIPSLMLASKSLAIFNTSCNWVGLFNLSLCSSKPRYFLKSSINLV